MKSDTYMLSTDTFYGVMTSFIGGSPSHRQGPGPWSGSINASTYLDADVSQHSGKVLSLQQQRPPSGRYINTLRPHFLDNSVPFPADSKEKGPTK